MNRFRLCAVIVVMILLVACSATLAADRVADLDPAEFWANYYNHMPQQKKFDTSTSEGIFAAQKHDKKERRKRGYAKPELPDEFMKYHVGIRTRADEDSPSYPQNYQLIELQQARSGRVLDDPLPWIERGPGNVAGRTRGLIVDPDDPDRQTWYAGSVGGGIWKTTNMGQSWFALTEDFPNLATTVLVMAESNHEIIYAGTGEGFFNIDAIEGNGIFKSTDRGESWEQLSGTTNNPSFSYINRIIVDPADENNVLAATNTGIYQSLDGGETWIARLTPGSRVQHLIANPNNFETQYATVNGTGIYKSENGGYSWASSSTGIGGGGRMEIAIAPSDTTRLYLAVDNYPNSDFYMSTDTGATWTELDDTSGSNPNWLGGQGWYDNTIAVDPYDPDIVYVGGINIWRIEVIEGEFATIESVELNGVQSFMTFGDWGGPFADGGIGTGDQLHGMATQAGLLPEDYTSVEIRFGPDMNQKAHRFIFPDPQNPLEVPPVFMDYIDVPFEVWDIDHERQLMASFVDFPQNGVFDLVEFDQLYPSQQFILVNAVAYDETMPSPNIAQGMGLVYKNTYAILPYLAEGASWEPNNLPASNIRINFGAVISGLMRNTLPVTVGTNIHVDHHNLVTIPINPLEETFRILNASDGGVAISMANGGSWLHRNGVYNTSQFYGVDKKHGANEYIGGMQDNGTWKSPAGVDSEAGSNWTFELGGDGYDTSWHYWDANKIIGGSQFNGFARSTDGGQSWFPALDGLADVGNAAAPFLSPLAKTNSDPDLLFAVGSSGVWRSDNFGENWTLCRLNTAAWDLPYLSYLTVQISIADPQIVWAGGFMGNAGRIHVSTDGGLTFSPVSNYLHLGYISGLETHPTDPQTAYALFSYADSPKILKTTDQGQTWEDITDFQGGASQNGFPDVATYSLLVMPHDPDIMWAGTEIGLFISVDGGESWAYADNGLPAVSIWQMRIVDNQVVLATHGRGIWTVDLPELTGYEPPLAVLTPRLNSLGQVPSGNINMDINLRAAYDSTQVVIDDIPAYTFYNDAPWDTLVSIPFSGEGEITAQLVAFVDGREYQSAARQTTLIALQPQAVYTNNFDAPSADFLGDAFSIVEYPGFDSPAIHTAHPYTDNRNDTYLLTKPIIVAEDHAYIRYDDIALIEPGDPGTVYGDYGFWDYVIVEGTLDGVNWLPLEDGYDARLYPEWRLLYDNNLEPDATYFKTNTINLTDTFEPGDVIFIRFRHYTDGYVTGWGWVIDNLIIQDPSIRVDSESVTAEAFFLGQNYPNPFNPGTIIPFTIPTKTTVEVAIYDVTGRLVEKLIEGELPAGTHSVYWNAAHQASGTYFYSLKAESFHRQRKLTLLK